MNHHKYAKPLRNARHRQVMWQRLRRQGCWKPDRLGQWLGRIGESKGYYNECIQMSREDAMWRDREIERLESQLAEIAAERDTAQRTLTWVVNQVKGYVPRIILRAAGCTSPYSRENVIPYSLADAANLYYALAESKSKPGGEV